MCTKERGAEDPSVQVVAATAGTIWWTVARVVTLVALLDKPVEDITIRSFGSASVKTTSKDPFSQCENLQNLQGIHIEVKNEYVGTLITSEVMTRMQSDKHNNMFNVAANLKHVETHENIN